MTTTVLNTKISEAENKIPNHDKYITTPKFSKLTAAYFSTRLKKATLVTKTDFDNKPATFNKRITSNEAKHLEIQKKLDSLIRKDYIFFLGRIYHIIYFKHIKICLFINQHLMC